MTTVTDGQNMLYGVWARGGGRRDWLCMVWCFRFGNNTSSNGWVVGDWKVVGFIPSFVFHYHHRYWHFRPHSSSCWPKFSVITKRVIYIDRTASALPSKENTDNNNNSNTIKSGGLFVRCQSFPGHRLPIFLWTSNMRPCIILIHSILI